jgi:hypothetical protein
MSESKVVLETGIPVETYQNKEQGFQSCYNESSTLQALSKHRSGSREPIHCGSMWIHSDPVPDPNLGFACHT